MTPLDLNALLAAAAKATFGPWDWWCNSKSKQIYLATVTGGRVYVMGFKRLGMDSAQPTFQVDHRMVPASKIGKPDHNGEINLREHPDANLIAISRNSIVPLAEALKVAVEALREIRTESGAVARGSAFAALAKIATLVDVGDAP